MTSTRLDLTRVLESSVGAEMKGLPGELAPLPLGVVGRQGWNVLAEDLPLPLLVLKQSALDHNVATMQGYCDRRSLLLAPHAKTTMSPQLMDLQLREGAWS